jgi:hypothetical protein
MRLAEKRAASPLASSWPSLWGLTFTSTTAPHPRARKPAGRGQRVQSTQNLLELTGPTAQGAPAQDDRRGQASKEEDKKKKKKTKRPQSAAFESSIVSERPCAPSRSISMPRAYGPRRGGAWQSRCLSRILQREATESLGADALLLKG